MQRVGNHLTRQPPSDTPQTPPQPRQMVGSWVRFGQELGDWTVVEAFKPAGSQFDPTKVREEVIRILGASRLEDSRMSDRVKIAAIAATAAVVAVGVFVYFSPYHSCSRAARDKGYEAHEAALYCARALKGG
jgi:hypothetical protein